MKFNGYLIIENDRIVNWKCPHTEEQADSFEWDVITLCRQVKTENQSSNVAMYRFTDGTLIHITYSRTTGAIEQIAIKLSNANFYTSLYRKISNEAFISWRDNIRESADELRNIREYLNDDGLQRLDALRALNELCVDCEYAYELIGMIDDTRIEVMHDEYLRDWDMVNALYFSMNSFIKDEIAQLRQIAILER